MDLGDGAYFVHFESNVNTVGFGTVIIRGSRIQGGDGGYIYRGYITGNGGVYRGRVAVIRVDPTATSLFGSVDRFELEISGMAHQNRFKFSGCVLGWETLRVRFALRSAMSLAAE